MKIYSAGITSSPLMLNESRIVLKLSKKFNKADLLQHIYSNNLFKYKTNKSIQTRITTIYSRIDFLNEEMKKYIIKHNNDESRLMVLFSIYGTNAFMRDFVNEYLSKKIKVKDEKVTKIEVDFFINQKRGEVERLSSLKQITLYKISEILRKILKESNILTNQSVLKIPVYEKEAIELLRLNSQGKLFVNQLGLI